MSDSIPLDVAKAAGLIAGTDWRVMRPESGGEVIVYPMSGMQKLTTYFDRIGDTGRAASMRAMIAAGSYATDWPKGE